MCALTCAVLAAPAAYALDEARIVEVSCGGMRVTQRGLPAGVPLEVNVVNTRTGAKLGEIDVVSSSAGTIDVQLVAPLRDVQQVVVEVERRSDETELGEVGADLPQPCSTTPRPLHPISASTPPSPSAAAVGPLPRSAAPRSPTPVTATSPAAQPTGERSSWLLVPVVLVAAGLAVVGGVLVGRRGRRPD